MIKNKNKLCYFFNNFPPEFLHFCRMTRMQVHVCTRTVVLPDLSNLPDSLLSTLTKVTSELPSYVYCMLMSYCISCCLLCKPEKFE